MIHWLTGQINERNGQLDEAIANYEAILGTTVPARGFDFSLDYEVLNALGGAAYARARLEAVTSAERQAFLRKAIAAYRRTLAIDSENVAAHYGLGLAYADPSWNAMPADLPKPGPSSEPQGKDIAEEIRTHGTDRPRIHPQHVAEPSMLSPWPIRSRGSRSSPGPSSARGSTRSSK